MPEEGSRQNFLKRDYFKDMVICEHFGRSSVEWPTGACDSTADQTEGTAKTKIKFENEELTVVIFNGSFEKE